MSAGDASKTVGQAVIDAVKAKNGTNVGKASIEVLQSETNSVKGDATITITTRDFIVEGTITIQDGILTWGEIDENKPGIRFNIPTSIEIYEDATQDVTATLKQIPVNTEVKWTSSDTAGTYVTVTPKTDTKQATIKGIAKTTNNVKIIATAGGYSATIEVKVKEEQIDKISDKKPASSSTTFEALGPKTLKDEVGNKVKIPQNFRLAVDTGDYVQDGVVIEDSEGNQFVWVPVGTIKKAGGTQVTIPLGRYSTFTGTPSPIQNVSNGYVTTTLEHEISNKYYEFAKQQEGETGDSESITITKALNYPNYPNGYETGNTKAKNIQEFVESANRNGGFYIARYEAGVKGVGKSDKNATYSIPNGISTSITFNKNGTLNSSTNEYELAASDASYLVSKKDVGVWNKINQPNAALMCQNMYASGSGVTSDLVNSYAWDTAIIFIQQCSGTTNYYNSSDGDGNIKETGEKGDEKCKINDMASNMLEWTTESYTPPGSPCVFRGGTYFATTTTSYRYFICTSLTGINDEYFGFRPLLYL